MDRKEELREYLSVARSIEEEIPSRDAPTRPTQSDSDDIVPQEIVEDTRPYIESIAIQINGTYESGWYDACFVMMRRLMETLLVECFVNKDHEEAIKGDDGEFAPLSYIVGQVNSGKYIHLSRSAKTSVENIKKYGDNSAHNPRYRARKRDIIDEVAGYRVLLRELMDRSGIG
jgi:hypothetical protein